MIAGSRRYRHAKYRPALMRRAVSSGGGGAAVLPTTGLVDDWNYEAAGSFFTERASPATPTTNGGVVGTWRGSVNAIDISAETDAKRPILNTARGVQFFWKTDGGTTNAKMLITSGLPSINRNNFSGGMIVDWPGTATTGCDFDAGSEFAVMPGLSGTSRFVQYRGAGAGYVSTTKVGTCERMVLDWRGTGSALEFWVNGSKFTGSALASEVLERIVMGSFSGGSENVMCLKRLVLYDAALSDADQTSLRSVLRTQAGTLGNGDLLCWVGDSLTVGVGSQTGLPFHAGVTSRALSERRAYAYDGAFHFSGPPVTAAQLNTDATGYTGEKVVLYWMGTNDIGSGLRNGQQLYDGLNTDRGTLQGQGWLVGVCKLQQLSANDAEAVNFNGKDFSAWDFVVDLRTPLPNVADGTKFASDGHLLDAGYALVTTAVQAALAGL